MYPQPQLNRLAAQKAALRRDIFFRRIECVGAATRIARPLGLVDRILAIRRQLPPFATAAAVPLGLFVMRTFFPKRKMLGSLIRWAPLVFSAVCGISSAVKSHPNQAQSPPARDWGLPSVAGASLPAQEVERLRALLDYGIMDTPPEPAFDELVSLAARICGTPIAAMSLIDGERLWVKASYGVTALELPRMLTFCTHVLNQPDELLIVPDATSDPRFAQNPFVTAAAGVRFYAGVPLCAPSGHVVGTLCVIGREPRTLTLDQQEALRVLGRQIMAQLQLRLSLSAANVNHARLENSQRIADLGDWEHDYLHQKLVWSDGIYRILGLARENVTPDSAIFYQHVHPDDLVFVHREKKAASEGNRRVDFQHRIIRPDGEVRYVHQTAELIWDEQGRPLRESGIIQDITERKRSEEALQRQQSELRVLFDLMPAMVWFKDTKNGVLRVNQRVAEAAGKSIGEIEGRPSNEIYPEAAAKYYADDLEVIRSGVSKLGIVELFRPLSGPEIWVQTDKVPYCDKDGKVIGIVVMSRDITASRQAAEWLRLLSSAVEQTKESVMITDAELGLPGPRIIFVNPAFTQMTGYSAAEAMGQTPRLLQGSRTDRAVLDRLRHNLERGETFEGETINYRKDGTEYDQQWQITPIRNAGGAITHFVAIQRDITERKTAELALRESEERFKLVARAVNDVVWDWNVSANTLWRDNGFQATFGYRASEIEPGIESWNDRIHPEEKKRVTESLHHAIAAGAEAWSAEYRFRRQDGNYSQVQDRGYILRDPEGKAVRVVGGMRDLTEQKKMEMQYLRAQRMESIGTLAGGIAHDLNNVLAPIMMSIELLRLETGDSVRRSRILDTIQTSSRRGADLVRQVLSFSRGMDGQRVAIRLHHLINELQGISREIFPRNIEILTDVARNLWPITGDPTQIHQVLLNLAVNARDAMPDGGTLTVTATNVTIDTHYAAMSPDARAGTYVLLQVTDTGQGIPPEVRERIFEPFFTTKEVGKGTGLGLATVHTIVKSHAGFVQVESEVSRGTTFKIYLPADQALRPPLTASPFGLELPRGKDELVLVVDDELSIRQITQQTLEGFGYRVITASDGAEAIALYSSHRPGISVVLTDMMMPIMDGASLIQVLRLINPTVRIIAASGLASGAADNNALAAGVDDFLLKPYTAETLLRLIRQVIDSAPSSRQP